MKILGEIMDQKLNGNLFPKEMFKEIGGHHSNKTCLMNNIKKLWLLPQKENKKEMMPSRNKLLMILGEQMVKNHLLPKAKVIHGTCQKLTGSIRILWTLLIGMMSKELTQSKLKLKLIIGEVMVQGLHGANLFKEDDFIILRQIIII